MKLRLPWAALGLTALASLLWALDGTLGRPVEYDRAAIGGGQLWRLMTGHLAHWSTDHLLWDAAVFAAVGSLFECRHGGRRFLVVVGGAALFISLGLWMMRPDVAWFRGLSGIDCAVVVAYATSATRAAMARGAHKQAIFGCILLLGYGAKLSWEVATGGTLFVESGPAAFVSLPLTHAIGGLWGLITALVFVEVYRRRGLSLRFAPIMQRQLRAARCPSSPKTSAS